MKCQMKYTIKNKKGSSLFVMLMLGVLLLILGLALAPALSSTVDESMSTAQLNCSDASINNQQKAECTSIDMQRFLFVGTIFGLAGLLLSAGIR